MRVRDYMLVLCMLALGALTCSAEVVKHTHNFSQMTLEPVTLTWPNGYKEGVTPLVTYTCLENATFASSAGKIGISFPQSGDYVTTSPAIDYLKRIIVTRTPELGNNLRFYYSTDGSTWTQITTGITVARYTIEVPLPTRGDYYLKIESSAKSVFISQIEYYTEPCNCFEYLSD